MSFHVGQKVVCVRAHGNLLGICGRWDGVLKKGEVYVVRWVGPSIHSNIDYIGIRLDGIVRADGNDTPFHVSRFRPIVSRKTDISALKALLVPGSKIRETA